NTMNRFGHIGKEADNTIENEYEPQDQLDDVADANHIATDEHTNGMDAAPVSDNADEMLAQEDVAVNATLASGEDAPGDDTPLAGTPPEAVSEQDAAPAVPVAPVAPAASMEEAVED